MNAHIDDYQFLAPNYLPYTSAVLSKGKGALIWDTDNRCYIDLLAGYSACNQGHFHPRLFATLVEQAQKLSLCPRSFHNDKLGEFARTICKYTGLDMMVPSSAGVESVEVAIKIARKWGHEVKKVPKNQSSIIVFDGNFHGRTTTVISFSSHSLYKDGFEPLMKGFHSLPYGDFDAIENALESNPGYIAVLVEPIQGEAGIISPPDGWLKHVATLCKKHNVLLIADEIQSGLGRCGFWFASEKEGVNPDMMILGKSLGGGFLPVSAVVGKHKVMSVLQLFTHGSTFGGNPLAAAVATEALHVIDEEGMVANSFHLGHHLGQRLRAIKCSAIKTVRCSGLWAGIELDITQIHMSDVLTRMFEKGVIVSNAHNSIRISPPLVINRFQLDTAIDKLEETLKEIV